MKHTDIDMAISWLDIPPQPGSSKRIQEIENLLEELRVYRDCVRETKSVIRRLIGAAQHAEYPQGDPPVCAEARRLLEKLK